MKLKKGNKAKFEYDLMLMKDKNTCVQINYVRDRMSAAEKRVIEKHLKNAVEEINSFSEIKEEL